MHINLHFGVKTVKVHYHCLKILAVKHIFFVFPKPQTNRDVELWEGDAVLGAPIESNVSSTYGWRTDWRRNRHFLLHEGLCML